MSVLNFRLGVCRQLTGGLSVWWGGFRDRSSSVPPDLPVPRWRDPAPASGAIARSRSPPPPARRDPIDAATRLSALPTVKLSLLSVAKSDVKLFTELVLPRFCSTLLRSPAGQGRACISLALASSNPRTAHVCVVTRCLVRCEIRSAACLGLDVRH